MEKHFFDKPICLGQNLRKLNLSSLQNAMICFYFFLTFFEPYLNGVIGSITKYYIIVLCGIILLCNGAYKFHYFHACFLFWLAYKIISVLWVDNFYIVRSHLFSQVGMVGLLVVLTSVSLSKHTIKTIKYSMWLGSFLIGFLSLFLSHPYHGTTDTRQVLFLFGQEADPNNQAASLLVGLSIALYELFYLKKHFVLSIITIPVNLYSLFMTGSRGGFVALLCIGVCLLWFLVRKKRIVSQLKITLVFAIFLICGILFAYFILPENIFQRLFDLSTYTGGSGRNDIWINTWELVTKDFNIILGAGWGDYYGYNDFYVMVHNTFLSMLCDVGIIGVTLFFLPIIIVCIKLLKEKYYLPLILLVASFIPSFFIEAINKRFFWNVVFLLFIYYVKFKNYNY